MLRALQGLSLALALVALAPSLASAQRMDLSLSRLRVGASDAPGSPCLASFTTPGGMPGQRDFCEDGDAWRRIATQFAASLIPPLVAPARTRGQAGFYLGIESFITGIDSSEEYWHRGVEGDQADPTTCPNGGACFRSRFVDGVLGWNRLSIRKGLPLGFELGTNVGFLVNTSYWTLGLEIRWALFEGFRRDGLEFIPDVSVRGAVQTLVGDQEFNMTVPALDVTLSYDFIIASVLELSPFLSGQIAWIFADTELVDLTPERDAYAESSMGNPNDTNHNQVFPRIRSTRARAAAGLQLRYEWFTLGGSFGFDLVQPSDLDGSLPTDLPRQYQIDIALGLSY